MDQEMFKHRAVTCERFTEGTDSFILDIGLFLFNTYGPYPTGQAPTLGIGTQILHTQSLPSGSFGPEETVSVRLSGHNLTNCSEGDAVCRALVH